MCAIPSFLESVGADGFKHQPTKNIEEICCLEKVEQKQPFRC
jgi:hypothetical protein